VGGGGGYTEAIRVIFDKPHKEKELIMSPGYSAQAITDFIRITRFVARMEASTVNGNEPHLSFLNRPQAPEEGCNFQSNAFHCLFFYINLLSYALQLFL
jgi:hypothetical protein